MNQTLPIALVFAALLGLEWRYRRGFIRVGTVALALVVWWFAHPGYATAAREAGADVERSTTLNGEPRSAYIDGVNTMYRYVRHREAQYSDIRLVVCVVLAWLACTPVFRTGRAAADRRAQG